MRHRLIFIVLILLITGTVFSADYETGLKNARVNWTRGEIISTGSSSVNVNDQGMPSIENSNHPSSINKARMNNNSAAREQAAEDLIYSLKYLRVDADNLLVDLINKNVLFQKQFSRMISRSVKYVDYPLDFLTTGCKARIKIGDIISSIPFDFPEMEFPLRDDASIETEYTGLIIDGRGLDVKPMLYPSIRTEDGLEIYGKYFVNGNSAVRVGMASYCSNEKEAFSNKKAGDRPYYLVAIKSIKGCPVISEKDARKILSSRVTKNNLKKCNVIIILNNK